MPDKRDMHKAKSHRNSKSSNHSAKPQNQAGAATSSTGTAGGAAGVPMEPTALDRLTDEMSGKKNKSRR
jgi:hypothetical protein